MGIRFKSFLRIAGTLVSLVAASSVMAAPNSMHSDREPLKPSQLTPEKVSFQGVKQSSSGTRRRFLAFTGFGCENYQDRFPITVGYTENGRSLIYAWREDYYFETGETAAEICFRVSNVLEELNERRLLDTISARQTSRSTYMICAAEDCSWPIFIISFPESPRDVVSDLYAALAGVAPSRRSNGGSR